jgi:hypothetical protein
LPDGLSYSRWSAWEGRPDVSACKPNYVKSSMTCSRWARIRQPGRLPRDGGRAAGFRGRPRSSVAVGLWTRGHQAPSRPGLACCSHRHSRPLRSFRRLCERHCRSRKPLTSPAAGKPAEYAGPEYVRPAVEQDMFALDANLPVWDHSPVMGVVLPQRWARIWASLAGPFGSIVEWFMPGTTVREVCIPWPV